MGSFRSVSYTHLDVYKRQNQAGGNNYVDITGLSIGTTYYFTCTSYCDALGWGSSYNVSCKTRGEIFYDYGRKPANLKFGQPPAYGISENKWEGWWLTNTKVRFNSDHIDIPHDSSNHYSPEFIFGSIINVSAFSKIFAEVQIVKDVYKRQVIQRSALLIIWVFLTFWHR